MRTITSFVTIVSCAILLNACSTTKLDDKTAAPAKATPAAVPDSRTVATVVAPSVDELDNPKGILAKRSVYFDFDRYDVKTEFNGLVEAHAKYLRNNKTRKIVIQGNTDERGGSEYNLALGQKRAEAVRHSLQLLGASDAQMEAVSFGKEKPKATGSDEASWAENRRADIVYSAK